MYKLTSLWTFGLIIGHQIHKRIMKENTLLLRVLCIMKGFSWIVFLIEWKITSFSKTTSRGSRFLQCVVLSTVLHCLKPSKCLCPQQIFWVITSVLSEICIMAYRNHTRLGYFGNRWNRCIRRPSRCRAHCHNQIRHTGKL